MKKVKFIISFVFAATVLILNFNSVSSTLNSDSFELTKLISMSRASGESPDQIYMVVVLNI